MSGYLEELQAYYAQPGYGELLLGIIGVFLAIGVAALVEWLVHRSVYYPTKRPADAQREEER